LAGSVKRGAYGRIGGLAAAKRDGSIARGAPSLTIAVINPGFCPPTVSRRCKRYSFDAPRQKGDTATLARSCHASYALAFTNHAKYRTFTQMINARGDDGLGF
jgi:hypothetical protein